MKISLDWLNHHLDRPTDPAEAERVLTDIGFPLDGVEPIGDGDTLLDVEVTSNRPDCLCHVGVARELAAATGRTLREPTVDLPAVNGPSAGDLSTVANDAPDLCPVYTARVIRGVKIGPSPDWLRRRIEAIGLRPVNNAVDVTNFVLHELGQPLHAFDMNRLRERRIVVRRAADAEPFTAIDGSKHALRPDMLVIADAQRPVAIAGVMGGLDSEVGDETTDILLESARFDPLSIRSTSRALKLASDSSYRFERGVDPRGVDHASRRAARLIVELAGGELAAGVIRAGEDHPPHRIVQMRPDRCNKLLGIDLPVDEMTRHLHALGLAPDLEPGLITCTIPSHRLDLAREADLIEEVARLHGFDHIPVEREMRLIVRPPQDRVQARQAAGRVLVAHGYHEAVTFSFLPPAQAAPFAAGGPVARVEEEKKKAEPALRPSLLPSLLACRKANQDAGNRDVRLFEVAAVFGTLGDEGDGGDDMAVPTDREGHGTLSSDTPTPSRGHATPDGPYAESRKLAMLADAESPADALRAMRGAIEELLETLGIADRVKIVRADRPPKWAEPAAQVVHAGDPARVLGAYGIATADTIKRFDLQAPVALAELDYESLIAPYPPMPRIEPLPRYPAIERDVSIIVDEPIEWAAIESHVRDARPALMERIDFVTTYRGKPVETGRKSVTFRITFRDPSRTLQHDEVTDQLNTVIARLTGHLGAQLRAT